MLVWLTLHFYDFCGFRFVAVNIVYKLQIFYINLLLLKLAASTGRHKLMCFNVICDVTQ